jgi:hypothetical protein
MRMGASVTSTSEGFTDCFSQTTGAGLVSSRRFCQNSPNLYVSMVLIDKRSEEGGADAVSTLLISWLRLPRPRRVRGSRVRTEATDAYTIPNFPCTSGDWSASGSL